MPGVRRSIGIGIGALLLASAAPVVAQRSVLAGVVMDTAGKPLQAAEVVAIRAKLRVASDFRGVFVLAGLGRGREVLQVRRIGFVSQLFELEFGDKDTVRIGVTLARDSVQRLPDVEVTAPAAPSPADRLEREAQERILFSGAPASAFVSRAELAKSYNGRLFPILIKHGLRSRNDRQGQSRLTCPRGSAPPTIWLDGLRMDASFSVENFSPDQIEVMEVYRSSVARPTQYNTPGSSCTVLIWTRR